MVRGAVTLVCRNDGISCASRWRDELGDPEVTVLETNEEDAAGDVVTARDRGGVVGVKSEQADCWLAFGVDESLSPSATPAELNDAIKRARVRAAWRQANREIPFPELGGLTFMGAALAHQLRNSLAAAILNCSVLEPVVEQSPDPDHVATLNDINESLQNITDVVNRMVSLTTEGEVEGVCDVTGVLIELASYLKKEMVRVADFEAEVPDEPCAVALSRARIVEVVSSLLNNAAFAVELVTTRQPKISLRLTQENDMIVIEVSDNGVGMAPEVRKKALHPFFTTRTQRAGAMGMGLTFAASTVRRIGGEILIDSEPNVGTSVRLYLPRLPSDEPSVRIIN